MRNKSKMSLPCPVPQHSAIFELQLVFPETWHLLKPETSPKLACYLKLHMKVARPINGEENVLNSHNCMFQMFPQLTR